MTQGELDIVGLKEAAAILGAEKSDVRKLANLPRKAAHLACGPIWWRSDIEAFARTRRRARVVRSSQW